MAAPIPGVTYTRKPGTTDWVAPGRPSLPGAPVTPVASTLDYYPNAISHPGAVWTRSGNTLSSPGRNDLPVYDITDGFRLGEDEPTWDNSGCRLPISALTTNTTVNLVTTADGQVIEGIYLPNGRIEVRHKNVTIRDCVIQIGWAPDGTGPGQRPYFQQNAAILCNPNFDTRNLHMEWVTCDPVNAGNEGVDGVGTRQTADSANVSGFYVSSGWAYRCKVRNVTDGFMPDIKPAWGDAPFHVWGCYVQTRWLANDPSQSDGTHNDCIQMAGGSDADHVGNALVNPTGGVPLPGDTSGKLVRGQCIVIDPYHATSDTGFAGTHDAAISASINIYKNWFYGAYTQVSNWLPYKEGGPGAPNVLVYGNRHGGQCVWPYLFTPTANATKRLASNNVAGPGGLKWNQVNGVGGVSTIAPGGAVNITVAANTDMTPNESHPSTAFAGSDQVAEPGTTFYLVGKGKDASNAWVKTGTWSVVTNSTPPITLSAAATSSDGASYQSFVVPQPTTTQTVVLRYTPTGVADTDDVTITIPPWQQ